jgi:hypothetical protein
MLGQGFDEDVEEQETEDDGRFLLLWVCEGEAGVWRLRDQAANKPECSNFRSAT